MADKSSSAVLLPISTVERETGVAKDTLRIWERRYGFPKPMRDRNGDRVYPLQQVERLRNIKRMIDNGFRPGKVIAGSLTDVPHSSARGAPGHGTHISAPLAHLSTLLQRGAQRELQTALAQQVRELGLRRFVMERVAPMNVLIGESWARGELSIHAEHLYCDLLNNTLRAALSQMNVTPVPPRVLLTTLPGEPHGLGLLMAQCVLAFEAADTVALGVETPIEDIAQAAQMHRADIVALSVSAAANATRLAKALAVLRARLPAATQLWLGGAGASKARGRSRGIAVIGGLAEIETAVAAWRAEHASDARPPSTDHPSPA